MFNFWRKRKFEIIFEEDWNSNDNFSKKDFNNFQKQLRKYLNWVYEKNIYLKKFDSIKFIVKSELVNQHSLHILQDKISLDKIEIEISFLALIEHINKVDFFDDFYNGIAHELVHIRHILFSTSFQKTMLFEEKMQKVVFENLKLEKANLRALFGFILSRSYVEGIAKFYEKERKYSLEEFDNIYEETKIWVETFIEVLNSILYENKEFNERCVQLIQNVYYNLGLVMVYSILLGKEEINQDVFN